MTEVRAGSSNRNREQVDKSSETTNVSGAGAAILPLAFSVEPLC